jgi:hypothetical protein
VLFDNELAYDMHSAVSLNSDKPPLIAFVALVATRDRVRDCHEIFQRLWNGAKRWDAPL